MRMLRTVLSMRRVITLHQLRREWWRALILVAGALWALSLVPAVLMFARQLSYRSDNVIADSTTAVTVILALGWVIVPLLVTGLDDTLTPSRFASLGLQARRLTPALTVNALLTVPSLFTLYVLLALAAAWRLSPPKPAATWVASVGAVLTWLSLVLFARIVTAWGARMVGSRRSRLVAAGIGGVILLGGGLTLWLILKDGIELVLEYDVETAFTMLAHTPLGAGPAAAEAMTDGSTAGVVVRLTMLAAWVAILAGAWHANVAHALVNPLYRGGGVRQRRDAILDAALARRRGPVRLALSQPALAVQARLRRSWTSDPRYLANLVSAVLMPLLLTVPIALIVGADSPWLFVGPLTLAATIGWGRHNDVAFDASGLWLDVVSGKLGADVMRGRLSAVVRWAVPAVIAGSVATLVVTGLWVHGAALIGACLGVLGMTLGVSAVSAVLFPYRAPAPGESPFAAEVGSVGASLVAQTASSLATAVLMPLTVVPLILSITHAAAWGLISAVIGPVLGIVAYTACLRLAGTVYDNRAGRLVTAVS